MCGIAGKIRYDGRDVSQLLAQMIERLSHRGPDDQGVFDDGVAALAHTRLSIIDLSPSGHQPMHDGSGRFTITYNGEVYNYRDLKRELADRPFRGTSDTEVVIEEFARRGVDAFARFNGMFACAIWDARARELTLARDRFGEKPLYYAVVDGELIFASEVRALLADERVAERAKPSIAGLNHYYALGYTLGEQTLYDVVKRLEPATYLRFREGQIVEKTRYWDYRRSFAVKTTEREADIVKHVDTLLEKAVRDRLVSDVPVGAFLSGGIDSSGVVAIARNAVSYNLQTFTIGFSEQSYDESVDARLVSQHFGTAHHERRLAIHQGDHSVIDRAIDCYDEPFSDTSLIPMVSVAELASEHVKVVLSGDGADEIFCGYPTYRADWMKQRLDALPMFVRRQLETIASKWPLSQRKTSLGFKLRQFSRGVLTDFRLAHYRWRELHTLEERVALLGERHADEIRASDPSLCFMRHYQDAADLDELSQHLYVDAKTFLVDDVLVKVDRATMAFSLEARAPYLDADLAAYSGSIPSHLKLNWRQQKYILKRALAHRVPTATLKKKKSGFGSPVNIWLENRKDNEYRYFNRYVAEHHEIGPGP
jgi:asparagine synthase (glutamine-hydrolysing)